MALAKTMEPLLQGNSAIRKMFELGQEMAEKYGKENVYDFSLGNPVAPVPYEVKNAIISLLENQDPHEIHGYMKNAGYDEVREQIARHLTRRFELPYEKEQILLCAGAAGGLNVLMRCLLDEEDEVLCFAPYFTEYNAYVSHYKGKLTVVPVKEDNFSLDIGMADRLIRRKTKAVILNNPNNPSGVVYKEEELKALAEMLKEAEERVGHPIYLICDEPYRELVYDDRTVPFMPALYENSIYLYSFSKTLSIPGERIGYLAIGADVEDGEKLMRAATIAGRTLGFVNAPSLFQKVISECLEVKVDVGFYDRNRRLLYTELTEMGFSCLPPEGAFYLLMKSPLEDTEAFQKMAEEEHIIMVPTDGFGLPGYFRLSYCIPFESIESSLPAFRALWEKVKHRKETDAEQKDSDVKNQIIL